MLFLFLINIDSMNKPLLHKISVAGAKITAAVFFLMLPLLMHAQENPSGFISGAGLNIGWYNPSLDYWQKKSDFQHADFGGAISVRAFIDARLAGDLHAVLGMGYWQESVEEDLQGFGNTRLLLTGYPFSLDLVYYITPAQFSVVTPYVGLGGEFLIVQHQLQFEEKDDPGINTGTTALGRGIAGLQARVSPQFALALDFNYKLGGYKQDFNKEIPNPDPEQPPTIEVVTEDISLDGPRIGLTLKYLF